MSEEYEPDSPIMTSETPLLSGSTATLTGESSLSGSPDASAEYNYVTGPDGQMYAVKKEPFVWKKFFIGLGVPLFLMILPLILMMIADSMDPWDYDGESQTVSLEKGEGTDYSTDFVLTDDEYLSSCRITEDFNRSDHRYYCHEDWHHSDWDEILSVSFVVGSHDEHLLVRGNGTAYSGAFTLSSNESVEWCEMPWWEESWYECQSSVGAESFTIIKETWGEYDDYPNREQVGHWNANDSILHFDDGDDHGSDFELLIKTFATFGGWSKETGVMHFDDGDDYGSNFDIDVRIETKEEQEDRDRQEDTAAILGGISSLLCMAAPLVSIGMIIYGFAASGGKALGIGATVALASYPIIGFFGCIAVLSGGF